MSGASTAHALQISAQSDQILQRHTRCEKPRGTSFHWRILRAGEFAIRKYVFGHSCVSCIAAVEDVVDACEQRQPLAELPARMQIHQAITSRSDTDIRPGAGSPASALSTWPSSLSLAMRPDTARAPAHDIFRFLTLSRLISVSRLCRGSAKSRPTPPQLSALLALAVNSLSVSTTAAAAGAAAGAVAVVGDAGWLACLSCSQTERRSAQA